MLDADMKVPEYINNVLSMYRDSTLPTGVYYCPIEERYYAVFHNGIEQEPHWIKPCSTTYEAHQIFQSWMVQALRIISQYYTQSHLYNETLCQGIRKIAERFEKDISKGRETVI